MKKRIIVLLFLMTQVSWSQVNFLEPYEMTIESAMAFESLHEEIDKIRFSFEAQQWPIEVLRYTLYRLRQNPYLTTEIFINVTIKHPNGSKQIVLPVPVNRRYIRAFRTEEGFNENYVDFLSDTYEWMIEGL